MLSRYIASVLMALALGVMLIPSTGCNTCYYESEGAIPCFFTVENMIDTQDTWTMVNGQKTPPKAFFVCLTRKDKQCIEISDLCSESQSRVENEAKPQKGDVIVEVSLMDSATETTCCTTFTDYGQDTGAEIGYSCKGPVDDSNIYTLCQQGNTPQHVYEMTCGGQAPASVSIPIVLFKEKHSHKGRWTDN